MSNERQEGLVTNQESVARQQQVPRHGVRVAELGRAPVEINLLPGETVTIGELVRRGHISESGAQIYVNMRPVSDENYQLQNGDTVVAVRKITGA